MCMSRAQAPMSTRRASASLTSAKARHAAGTKMCPCSGAKADPTRIRIADVSDSIVDPLARAVRQRLRRDHSIEAGIPIVLSTEKPRCALVPIQEMGDNPLDYQVLHADLLPAPNKAITWGMRYILCWDLA